MQQIQQVLRQAERGCMIEAQMRSRSVPSEPSVAPGKRVTNRRYRGWWIAEETLRPYLDWTAYVVWSEDGRVDHKSFLSASEAERYVDGQLGVLGS